MLSGDVMRALPFLAAAAVVVSAVSSASADPICATPCVSETRVSETPTKMRSIPLFATGIVFDVVGAAATATGVGILAASRDCGPQLACSVSGTLIDLAGIAALAGGAVFLAIGIPLTVVGARSVPDVQARSGRSSALVWTF